MKTAKPTVPYPLTPAQTDALIDWLLDRGRTNAANLQKVIVENGEIADASAYAESAGLHFDMAETLQLFRNKGPKS